MLDHFPPCNKAVRERESARETPGLQRFPALSRFFYKNTVYMNQAPDAMRSKLESMAL